MHIDVDKAKEEMFEPKLPDMAAQKLLRRLREVLTEVAESNGSQRDFDAACRLMFGKEFGSEKANGDIEVASAGFMALSNIRKNPPGTSEEIRKAAKQMRELGVIGDSDLHEVVGIRLGAMQVKSAQTFLMAKASNPIGTFMPPRKELSQQEQLANADKILNRQKRS